MNNYAYVHVSKLCQSSRSPETEKCKGRSNVSEGLGTPGVQQWRRGFTRKYNLTQIQFYFCLPADRTYGYCGN